METSSYTADLRDVEFVLFEHLQIDAVLEKGIYAEVTADDVKMILEYGAAFASEVVAPTNARSDREGCTWDDGKVKVPEVMEGLWEAAKEQGWIGLVAPEAYGGQSLPKVVGSVVDEMIIGSNGAFHTYVGLSRAAANLLLLHGSDALKETYVSRLLSGEWQGTMCLTEAGAGSDVGASRTTAKPNGDGTYQIKGTKTFISAGEHQLTNNHIHLVLARLPDAASGVKGLSLFLVPKYRLDENGQNGLFNDVYCSGIEEKMGLHGSATTTLQFGDKDGCVGYLIGREHQGIRCMFHMMNEERIVVGLQGQALAGNMYFHALKYAQERVQGSDISKGKSITEEKVPIINHPDVRRMLMTVRAYAEGGRALLFYTSMQQDLAEVAETPEEKAYHDGRMALLTPICKSWASESGVQACLNALQVYGGYGYTADYPAEQYVRDSVIATIYEGTNGIQAIDLLFRKVMGGGGKLAASFQKDISAWIGEHIKHPVLGGEVRALAAAAQGLGKLIEHLIGIAQKGDVKLTALGASDHLTAFGNVVVGWLLLQQAVLSSAKLESYDVPGEASARETYLEENDSARFYAGKVETARFFIHQILSQNFWKQAQIMSNDSSAVQVVF